MEITTLKEQIRQVALGREQLQKYYASKKESYEKWQESNKEMLSIISFLEEAQAYGEDYLRQLTIKAFQETGDKKPCEGVGIREIIKLDYDPKIALEWAKKTGLALQLDRTTFERIAKADKPDFVGFRLEIQPTIATELKIGEDLDES